MGDVIDLAILTLIYFLVFFRRWKAKGRDVLVINTLMYVYLICVLYFTLMPIATSLPFVANHGYKPMNLSPFIDVVTGRGDYERQIILNVIMMAPFGFLLPLVQRSRNPRLWKTLLATLLLSLAIETLQPLLSDYRMSDITDVITNVIGGLVGYGLYLVFRPIVFRLLDGLKSTKVIDK